MKLTEFQDNMLKSLFVHPHKNTFNDIWNSPLRNDGIFVWFNTPDSLLKKGLITKKMGKKYNEYSLTGKGLKYCTEKYIVIT